MPFDAFLFESFGGPNCEADILPFLENVTRGRNVPKQRLDVVAQQYRMLGGKSPINEINRNLIERLREAFLSHQINLPIYFGNRHFTPFTSDALKEMKADGRKMAIAFVTSAYGSYSSCKQYKVDFEASRSQIGDGAPEVVKIRHFYSHPGFIEPLVENTVLALEKLPRPSEPMLLFTAHSIPQSMADSSPYLAQLQRAVELTTDGVEQRIGRHLSHSLVFQSRSGPPTQQWLAPDVCDHLETLASTGINDVLLIPIGFVSDHMEVVYDLDYLAIKKAQALEMNAVRVKTPSDSPKFIEMIVDLVKELLYPGYEPKSLGGISDLNGCSETCCKTRH